MPLFACLGPLIARSGALFASSGALFASSGALFALSGPLFALAGTIMRGLFSMKIMTGTLFAQRPKFNVEHSQTLVFPLIFGIVILIFVKLHNLDRIILLL